MTDRLLLSVHDVTPFHFERLVRIEHFLAAKAVTHATYLLVPRFHGRWAIEHDRGFAAWCRASRAFDVRWFLHGFYHDEAT
jgi:predicted deacetylase